MSGISSIVIEPNSSLRRGRIPAPIIASHFASSTTSAPTSVIQKGPRPVDLSYEAVYEDEAEYLTSEGTKPAKLLSQSSSNNTAPWIWAWRRPYAPKKPMDTLPRSGPAMTGVSTTSVSGSISARWWTGCPSTTSETCDVDGRKCSWTWNKLQ